MPQIANQDYNVIRPTIADAVWDDAAALGILAGHLDRGTIFDVVLNSFTSDYARVIGLDEDLRGGASITVYNTFDGKMQSFNVVYTSVQYEGLSAIQKSLFELDPSTKNDLPALTLIDSEFLSDAPSGSYVCIDNKYVGVNYDQNHKITDLFIYEDGPESDYVNLSWEDAKKLIGLPILHV